MARGDEGFVRRWSRLKRLGGDGLSDEAAAREEGGVAPADDSSKFVPKDLDLPDIGTLHKDSDFTAFLRKAVPEHLQRLALRKLWRADPIFSVIDGLDDYDENFRAMDVAAALMQEGRKAVKKLAGAEDKKEEEPVTEELPPEAPAEAEDDSDEVAEDEPLEVASEGSEKPSTS